MTSLLGLSFTSSCFLITSSSSSSIFQISSSPYIDDNKVESSSKKTNSSSSSNSVRDEEWKDLGSEIDSEILCAKREGRSKVVVEYSSSSSSNETTTTNKTRRYVINVNDETAQDCEMGENILYKIRRKDLISSSSSIKKQSSVILTERFFLSYGIFWITCFALIVGLQWFLWFDKIHYIVVCVGLATPLLLQPFVAPSLTEAGGDTTALLTSSSSSVPFYRRFSFKANVWIAIFSFIGNYWYTHYFYSVLKAQYTFPSWDVNGVPIAMFFATHFYFTFYHALSNTIIRKILNSYEYTNSRTAFLATVILLISYVTAYMETLTISGFTCYTFENRSMVYALGSAFYGIYFIVSFPMYYRVNENTTLWDTIISSLATGMMVLLLLDFVRVFVVGEDLNIRLLRPCKFDATLTCAPFTGSYC